MVLELPVAGRNGFGVGSLTVKVAVTVFSGYSYCSFWLHLRLLNWFPSNKTMNLEQGKNKGNEFRRILELYIIVLLATRKRNMITRSRKRYLIFFLFLLFCKEKKCIMFLNVDTWTWYSSYEIVNTIRWEGKNISITRSHRCLCERTLHLHFSLFLDIYALLESNHSRMLEFLVFWKLISIRCQSEILSWAPKVFSISRVYAAVARICPSSTSSLRIQSISTIVNNT